MRDPVSGGISGKPVGKPDKTLAELIAKLERGNREAMRKASLWASSMGAPGSIWERGVLSEVARVKAATGNGSSVPLGRSTGEQLIISQLVCLTDQSLAAQLR